MHEAVGCFFSPVMETCMRAIVDKLDNFCTPNTSSYHFLRFCFPSFYYHRLIPFPCFSQSFVFGRSFVLNSPSVWMQKFSGKKNEQKFLLHVFRLSYLIWANRKPTLSPPPRFLQLGTYSPSTVHHHRICRSFFRLAPWLELEVEHPSIESEKGGEGAHELGKESCEAEARKDDLFSPVIVAATESARAIVAFRQFQCDQATPHPPMVVSLSLLLLPHFSRLLFQWI